MTTIEKSPARSLAQYPSVQSGTALTARERQVLDLASRGCTNAIIGRRLHVSEDTVKTWMRKLFVRLGATDRAHAVRRGFELGILTPDRPGGES